MLQFIFTISRIQNKDIVYFVNCRIILKLYLKVSVFPLVTHYVPVYIIPFYYTLAD